MLKTSSDTCFDLKQIEKDRSQQQRGAQYRTIWISSLQITNILGIEHKQPIQMYKDLEQVALFVCNALFFCIAISNSVMKLELVTMYEET